ncbi:MAG: ABC transporter substrate-binding protein [Ruminococcus sp.]|nr:ABC transporter substrate-binding protein [Ruminococcus sp.]
MKRTLSILSLVLALVMMMSLAACAGKGEENTQTTTVAPTEATEATEAPTAPPRGVEPLNVYTLKGPTGMGMAEMITEGNDDDSEYNFTVVSAPDEITAAIINGDADIAACPVNLASVLYSRTNGGVKILAVNTLGVTYIVTNGTEVNSIEDLRGKTIVSAGQGATPEFILNKLLADSGLTVGEDVFVEYKSEHSDVASLIVSGQADVALLPEPNVTSSTAQNAELTVALDLTKEWETKYGTKLVQGCVIARNEAITTNAWGINEFLDDYADSVEFINTASDEAAQMIVDAGIIPKAPIAKKAIPTSYITFIVNDDMKALVKENLQVLYDAKPASVGGTLPDDNFYYNYVED